MSILYVPNSIIFSTYEHRALNLKPNLLVIVL